MSGKVADLLAILFFALLIALVFQQIATSMTEQDIASGGPYDNAASYPRSLAILLGALLIGYVATVLTARRPAKGASKPTEASEASEASEPTDLTDAAAAAAAAAEAAAAAKDTTASTTDDSPRRGVLLLIVFAAYLWLLPTIGYHLATPLMLGCLLTVAGTRQVIGTLAFSVALSIGTSFVFEVFLNIVLPGGRFALNIPWPSF